jgi:hypothetical protein
MGGYKKADGSTGFLMADGSVNTTTYLQYSASEVEYNIPCTNITLNSVSLNSLKVYIYFLGGFAIGGCINGVMSVAHWNNATAPIKSSGSILSNSTLTSAYWPQVGPINLCHLKQIGNKSNNTFSAWLDSSGYLWTQGSNYDITDGSNPYYQSSSFRYVCGYWMLTGAAQV